MAETKYGKYIVYDAKLPKPKGAPPPPPPPSGGRNRAMVPSTTYGKNLSKK